MGQQSLQTDSTTAPQSYCWMPGSKKKPTVSCRRHQNSAAVLHTTPKPLRHTQNPVRKRRIWPPASHSAPPLLFSPPNPINDPWSVRGAPAYCAPWCKPSPGPTSTTMTLWAVEPARLLPSFPCHSLTAARPERNRSLSPCHPLPLGALKRLARSLKICSFKPR